MNRIAAHRSAADGASDPLSDATRHASSPLVADIPAARTRLLVVDTSTDACAVAVCVPVPSPPASPSALSGTSAVIAALPDGVEAAESAWPEITIRDDIVAGVRIVACWRRTGAVSSEALLPMVQAVLDAADTTLQACGAIAFGAGPGSFTGVRTATGAAQGLAFANDMPVVPLDTLMACAESARQRAPADARPTKVYVAVDARMGECYAAAFSWCEEGGVGAPLGHWQVDIDAHVAPPSGLGAPPAGWTGAAAEAGVQPEHSQLTAYPSAATSSGFVLAGNGVSVFGDALPLRALASACDEAAWPEPLALAALGWQRWHEGAAVPAAMAQPRYIRDKVALTTQERLAVKEAKSASKEGGA